jgi:hypothetical protein
MLSEQWKLVEYGNGSWGVVDSRGVLLFSSGCPAQATKGEMQKAAAAPDLYTALEELLKFGAHDGPCDNCDPETGEPYDEAGACDAHWNACKAREQIARAALAKARGEKPSC